jgi:hypothetical protein
MIRSEFIPDQNCQESQPSRTAGAKWAALVDDVIVPLPQRVVKVGVIKSQAGVADDHALVRDHNSPDDVVIGDDELVDLALGNNFYRLPKCDVRPRNHCLAPPKLAYFVDDRAEITINPNQTGTTVREWFGLPANCLLVRDLESPIDDQIGPNDPAKFADGSVFYSREAPATLRITVNHRVFTEANGVKREMSGVEIAALVFPEDPRQTTVRLHSAGDRPVGLDEVVHIKGCEVFDVTRCNVVGGFEAMRVEREVEQLRSSGAPVTLVTEPTPVVVYHDLRTRSDFPVTKTDVLVPVPGGYPGQMIDWAYLPDDSPLIGKVNGSPQDHCISVLSRVWRQISYHPHRGGGGPAWNPTLHGFHTYIGEVMSWLSHAA